MNNIESLKKVINHLLKEDDQKKIISKRRHKIFSVLTLDIVYTK